MTLFRYTVAVLAVLLMGAAAPLHADETATETAAAPAAQPADEAGDAGGGGVDGGVEASATATNDEEELLDDPYLVGWLELDGVLLEGPPRFAWGGRDDGPASLRQVIEQLNRVAGDPRYLGVTIRLSQPMLTLTQIQEISAALADVRAADQTVIVASDAYDLQTYLLASAADKVVLQHKGWVELSGLGVEETYLGGLLEMVGAKADLLQVGKYKGADESLTREGPSEAWNQNIDGLLDDLYGVIIDKVTQGRGLDRAEIDGLMRDGWTMRDDQYVKSGLVDHMADRDLIEVTGVYYGDEFEWDDLLAGTASAQNMDNPFAVFGMLFKQQKTVVSRPSIAVVHAIGPIVTGESSPGGMFDGESVGSTTMIDTLAEARDNELIKGVVLRIDSPGGSAMASELIWQAVRELGETKPVYASIGTLAASGGYYIACGSHEIYASPASILGSIGVVGGKIVLGGLYEKIGVNVHRRSRGPLGDMFNSVEPFTEEQRTALEAAMSRIYDQFTNRVQIGRGKRIENIENVAQGRLFTGKQSAQNGLADQVGGLNAAIEDLAAQLKLEPGTYDIIDLPEPQGLSELLETWFAASTRAPSPAIATTRAPAPPTAYAGTAGDTASLFLAAKLLLGPQRWRAVSPLLTAGLLLQTEHALTLLPAAITLH